MKIYYWYNQGRLGNLILQYLYIKSIIGPNDIVLCCENQVFDLIYIDKRFFSIPTPKIVRLKINFYVNSIFSALVKNKLISEISPLERRTYKNYTSEVEDVSFQSGRLLSLISVKGFFQNDSLVVGKDLNIKNYINFTRQRSEKNFHTVALHIRLTDYKTWAVYGKEDVSLPINWYREAINKINELVQNPKFIVYTDDKILAQSILDELGVSYSISTSNNEINDFISLSLCDHAIISPSTFAYCAALSSYKNKKIIIAPKYWAGFKSKTWFPATIMSEAIIYLAVEDLSEPT